MRDAGNRGRNAMKGEKSLGGLRERGRTRGGRVHSVRIPPLTRRAQHVQSPRNISERLRSASGPCVPLDCPWTVHYMRG